MRTENKSKIYDVVIAGAGPVGLFLACELRLAGVDVLVLDALVERTTHLKIAPLGIRGLSVATVEAFYRRNMLQDLTALAKSDKRGGHFAGIGIDLAHVDESRWIYRLAGPAAQAMGASMQQIEDVLLSRATELGVRVEYGCRVTNLKTTPDFIEVSAGDDVYRTKWMVGCDGGRSDVRRIANFEFAGTEAEFTAYYGLVQIADPEKLKPGRNLTPAGFYMQPLPGFISVMEFDGGAFDRSQGISREHFQAVLRRVSGTDVTITDLKIATSYTDRAKQTTTLQKGRILLAGDAAHVHSPLGGQGLNLGIGDALNLGWKLASVVKGSAPEALLTTYQSERHPVAEWVLDWTRAQVQLMKPDPHSKSLRTIVSDLIKTTDGATYLADKLWSVSLRYELGSDHPLVGRSVPDFEFADGSRIGSHFEKGQGIYLVFAADERPLEFMMPYSERVKIVRMKPTQDFGIRSLLIRPDGVIAWVSDQGLESGDLRSTLVRWFGA